MNAVIKRVDCRWSTNFIILALDVKLQVIHPSILDWLLDGWMEDGRVIMKGFRQKVSK